MYDIITFGSATRDVFLKSKNFRNLRSGKFITGRGICFDLGTKIKVDDLFFATGGGGTNIAATFAKQGFKTAYVGKVGIDPGGETIEKELKDLKIKTFLSKDRVRKTAYSIIFTSRKGRTILVHHGACHFLKKEDIPFSQIRAKWIYIASLSGESITTFQPIVDFAKKNNIKIALNPGRTQLGFSLKKIKSTLSNVDVLILNQEEAAVLTKINIKKDKKIIQRLKKWTKGLVVVTKGDKGCLVCDGSNIFSAGVFKEKKYIDRTGAGDAFGSGFVAGLIRTKKIEQAIKLATANATSMVENLGAKNGILTRKEFKENNRWKKLKIIKTKL